MVNSAEKKPKDIEFQITGCNNKNTDDIIKYAILKRTDNNIISNCVFVSGLYNTWCTAVLLYSIGQPQETPLYLNVVPYLKKRDDDDDDDDISKKFLNILNTTTKLINNAVFIDKLPIKLVLSIYEKNPTNPKKMKKSVYKYKKEGSEPIPVTVVLDKINPFFTVVREVVEIRITGDEKTAFRFVLDKDGNIKSFNKLKKSLMPVNMP